MVLKDNAIFLRCWRLQLKTVALSLLRCWLLHRTLCRPRAANVVAKTAVLDPISFDDASESEWYLDWVLYIHISGNFSEDQISVESTPIETRISSLIFLNVSRSKCLTHFCVTSTYRNVGESQSFHLRQHPLHFVANCEFRKIWIQYKLNQI